MILHRNKTRAIREFERWAKHYDRSVLNVLLFWPSYRLMVREVRKRATKCNSPLRILDIGCGTGSFATRCLATDLKIEVTGLDMAYNMISRARRKNSDNGHNGSHAVFTVGDAENLPFETGYFDMITCSNSFHHYPHQLRALREMHRVIKPGGELLVIDGHRDDPLGYLIFDVCVDAAEKHIRHCSRDQFAKLFRKAGFQKITQRMRGLLPPLLITMGQA